MFLEIFMSNSKKLYGFATMNLRDNLILDMGMRYDYRDVTGGEY